MQRKEPKRKGVSYYKNKAWKEFSRYVRFRDCLATTGTFTNGRCVTCGKLFPFEELQAGHGIGKRNNSILLDEQLVNAQCRSCNFYGNGEYAKYSVWFIKKYGLELWEEKVRISKQVVSYKSFYWEEKYLEYKDKVEQLLLTGLKR